MLHRAAKNKEYYVPGLLKLSRLHLNKTKPLIIALAAVHVWPCLPLWHWVLALSPLLTRLWPHFPAFSYGNITSSWLRWSLLLDIPCLEAPLPWFLCDWWPHILPDSGLPDHPTSRCPVLFSPQFLHIWFFSFDCLSYSLSSKII